MTDYEGVQVQRRLAPASAPMEVARAYAADRLTHPHGLLLRHWRGSWWQWESSRWTEFEDRAVSADAYRFTEAAVYADKDGKLAPWAPNRHRIGDFLDALKAVTHLPEATDQPGWIGGEVPTEGVIVACRNGLLDVSGRELLPHTPMFWNQTAVPFDYDAGAPAPDRWLQFLDDLWPGDADSIAALQEWFGYVISGRLDLQKILLVVGPTRGGKGVIARLMGALVGPANVAGPTLSSLSTDFGMAPMLGKPLAVISDARLGSRDSNVVVERLLSISGEDTITVNRKYREQWTGKLPTRLVVSSNGFPRLGDASAAIAGRFIPLLLTRSWLGNEDTALEPAIHRELSGILNWALDGLDRLQGQGRFTVPPSATEAFVALADLASPVAAFIRDCCEIDLGHQVLVDDVWKAWRNWCDEDGHRAGSKQMFGRNLRAVLPGVRRRRLRDGDDRTPVYEGVRLK